MKRLLCIAALLAAAPLARADEVLSFDQVLSRAESAHAIPQNATRAADALAQTPRVNFPTIRAETSASSAENVDIFAQNVLRFDAYTAIVALDYTIADGGLRDKEAKVAKLDAASFHARMREAEEDLFRETLDAVAQLYSAQERLRILNAGLARAVGMRDRAKQLLDLKEISNVTAAQWQDESIAAESQLLDLQLQRLEAETHVKQLMGDTSPGRIDIVINLEAPAVRALSLAANPDPLVEKDEGVARATMAYERKRLALEEAQAARQPQLMLSGFGGVAALSDALGYQGRQRYGIYGVRFTVALPMFDGATARRVAEARLDAEEADLERRTTTELIRRQTSTMWLGIAALEKRTALLSQAVDVAKQREESVVRLASAGIKSEAEVAEAAAERTKRESDLLAARVEMWKYQQMLQHRAGNDVRVAASDSSSSAPSSGAPQ